MYNERPPVGNRLKNTRLVQFMESVVQENLEDVIVLSSLEVDAKRMPEEEEEKGGEEEKEEEDKEEKEGGQGVEKEERRGRREAKEQKSKGEEESVEMQDDQWDSNSEDDDSYDPAKEQASSSDEDEDEAKSSKGQKSIVHRPLNVPLRQPILRLPSGRKQQSHHTLRSQKKMTNNKSLPQPRLKKPLRNDRTTSGRLAP